MNNYKITFTENCWAILCSLDKPDQDIEKSWVAESEARYEAYKRGELKAYDWDDIKKGMDVKSSFYISRK